jgi:hypothetical protein
LLFHTRCSLNKQRERERANEEAACCKVALGIDENERAKENIYNIVDCPTTIREQFCKKSGGWGKKMKGKL